MRMVGRPAGAGAAQLAAEGAEQSSLAPSHSPALRLLSRALPSHGGDPASPVPKGCEGCAAEVPTVTGLELRQFCCWAPASPAGPSRNRMSCPWPEVSALDTCGDLAG